MASSLFVSDLHLSEERPAANERFFSFMEELAPRAAALYVLGDLFEYWIGDDDLAEPFNAVIAGFFRRVSDAGARVYLMHGNRDFLLGEGFCAATGATLLDDPTVAEIGGVRTALMHGDTLCTDDVDYQAWRRVARSDPWQREFLSKSLGDRREVIVGLREKSREVIQAKPADIMDVNGAAVQQAFAAHGVKRLIHGHTHRAGKHRHGAAQRWVLPDWYGPGGYLEISESGAARLVTFT